jgi:hypothetical protein
MTPSRPYAPETRSVPLTFMDCPEGSGIVCYRYFGKYEFRELETDCQKIRESGNCHKGFAP